VFAEPLVLNDGSADRTFSMINRRGANETERLNVATDLTEPEKIVIRHSTSGPKTLQVDRHNVVLFRTERDSVTGQYNTLSMSLTINVPRTGQFSLAEIEALRAMLNDALDDDDGMARLLRGES
jgi:hypothetical protein